MTGRESFSTVAPTTLAFCQGAQICPTDCDDDCDTPCHEWHEIPSRRDHQPDECPSAARKQEPMTEQPTKTRPGDQPLSNGGQECVQDKLIALIEERKQLGIERYGSPLMTHNGRDAGRDAVEEALDLTVYSMQVAMELRDLRAGLDGAYRERAQLLALLAALHPSVIAPALDVDDDGWQILYLHVGGKQASWHIAPRDADLFTHVEHVPADDRRAQWDGHTTEEKYARIGEHAARLYADACGRVEMPLTPADAAVARVRAAVHIADAEDVTDWQRGYRACAANALRALDGEQP